MISIYPHRLLSQCLDPAPHCYSLALPIHYNRGYRCGLAWGRTGRYRRCSSRWLRRRGGGCGRLSASSVGSGGGGVFMGLFISLVNVLFNMFRHRARHAIFIHKDPSYFSEVIIMISVRKLIFRLFSICNKRYCV